MREAELVRQFSDIPMVIVDAEAGSDEALQIHPPPAHDAVGPRIGTVSTIAEGSAM
jgi:hypothetical protein